MKYVADAYREVQCKAMHTKLVARRVVAGSAACTIVPGTGCMKFAADKPPTSNSKGRPLMPLNALSCRFASLACPSPSCLPSWLHHSITRIVRIRFAL
jgi:hypothetical protein